MQQKTDTPAFHEFIHSPQDGLWRAAFYAESSSVRLQTNCLRVGCVSDAAKSKDDARRIVKQYAQVPSQLQSCEPLQFGGCRWEGNLRPCRRSQHQQGEHEHPPFVSEAY